MRACYPQYGVAMPSVTGEDRLRGHQEGLRTGEGI